jgi:hypothetical protein
LKRCQPRRTLAVITVGLDGLVVEQAQILTTHDLAVVVDALDVTPPAVGPCLPGAPSPA